MTDGIFDPAIFDVVIFDSPVPTAPPIQLTQRTTQPQQRSKLSPQLLDALKLYLEAKLDAGT